MRFFISIIVLIFSLQSLSKANNISEFQIEGISIGDSLLDYYTLKNIKSKKKLFYPKSKKHYLIEFTENLVKYDSIGIHVKENDNEAKEFLKELKNKYFAGLAAKCLLDQKEN